MEVDDYIVYTQYTNNYMCSFATLLCRDMLEPQILQTDNRT